MQTMGALLILALATLIIGVWMDWLRRSLSGKGLEDAYRDIDSGKLDVSQGNRHVVTTLLIAALSGVVMLGVIALTYSILADQITPMRDPF